MGNSGTGVRLLMGVAAAHPFPTFFTGDVSLVQRPMTRVAHPLSRMGANILARGDGHLPLVVTGTESLIPIVYELPVPSAQVKSAILLAGISAPGETTVIEPQTTRDHTERLLRRFGANVQTEALSSGNRVTVVGEPELVPAAVDVPGDASSAAFAVVAKAPICTVVESGLLEVVIWGVAPPLRRRLSYWPFSLTRTTTDMMSHMIWK